MFLRPDGETRGIALDEESRKLFTLCLRKNNKKIRETAVRDPHLLAVQHVMAAVCRGHGARAGISRSGTRRGLREGECGDPLAGRELRKVLLFLCLGAVPNDGQCADAHMSAEGCRETPE